MGACLSLPDDGPTQGPCNPLFFHPYYKGSQIILDEFHCVASRAASFHDGIVFSNRPIKLYEKVTLKILKQEVKWCGGLRVGFTTEDPSYLDPKELPPFACPNLVHQGKCWACVLPDECGAEGNTVSFWVDGKGRVFASTNQNSRRSLLFRGVSVNKTLWAVVDVYGRTKAVELLDPSKPHTHVHQPRLQLLKKEDQIEWSCQDDHHPTPGEECSVCFLHAANAAIWPCRHTSFCYCCCRKIFDTSRCCPLCRCSMEGVIRHWEKRSPRMWLDEAKDIQPPP